MIHYDWILYIILERPLNNKIKKLEENTRKGNPKAKSSYFTILKQIYHQIEERERCFNRANKLLRVREQYNRPK